jgi:hypothetical protein
MSNRHLKELNIESLFKSGNYTVPIYQRNYAWGEKEVVQLINDIKDYRKHNKKNNYYIGTLIVFNRNNIFEVIDGQQRLTTLYILISVLKNKFNLTYDVKNFQLKFDSREKSSKTLMEIYNSQIKPKDELNTHILDNYDYIEKELKNLSQEERKSFFDYLKEKVIVLRVEVPKETDLNHYFEIMNNRGEQLEKHEIVKSRMLNKLKNNKDETSLFNTIWEACSNMEQYVQYGFSPNIRNIIFSENWNEFKVDSFDNILSQIDINEKKEESKTLLQLIDKNSQKIEIQNNKKSDNPERFNSVINFQNFLLHVLKIQKKEDISLDDKQLLEHFDETRLDDIFVKKFAFNMLKIKFLFDNYIIKREYSTNYDEWSLKQLIKSDTGYYKNRFENNEENRETLMLLSMFHVSYPTIIYKHWLNACLNYLFYSKEIVSNEYIKYLQKLSKSFLKYRFLTKERIEYHKIIYENNFEIKNFDINYTLLDEGVDVENFIFNYLDYLLWKDNKTKYSDFYFTFRTSIEHYYPQNPMENIEELDKYTLDDFGNLCLISRNENSRLSNFTTKAKKDFYLKQQNNSIKQIIMMEYENWSEKEITEHKNKMIQIIKNSL